MGKHTFVINSEEVNSYGYRVLTAGVDYSQFERNPVVLYMHRRAFDSPKSVIGRASDLRVNEKNQLVADIEFDSAEEFAKEVEGKVERGFIKMASIHGPIIEASEDADVMLQGQQLPTVTKMKLKEISIVDIGGSDEALKLFDVSGNEISLSDFPGLKKSQPKQTVNNKMEELTQFVASLAVTLGLQDADANASSVLAHVSKLKQDNVSLNDKVEKFEKAEKDAKAAEAVSLVDKAVEKGVLPDHLKEVQLNAFTQDFGKAKSQVEALLAKAEDAPEGGNATHEVKLNANNQDFLKNVGSNRKEGGADADKGLLDYSEVDLAEMKVKDPKKYATLVENYEPPKENA